MENTRKEYEAIRNKIPKLKDCSKCVNCHSTVNIELHHIVPLALGGTNNISNIVPLCEDCHCKIHNWGHRRELQKQGAIKSMKQGRLRSTGKLYGYELGRDKLTIIESEANVIRLIFDLYEQGLGIRRIQNKLESEGITTREGNKFGESIIGSILQNEKYIGTSIANKHGEGGKLKDESEWIIYKYGDILPDGTVFDKIPPIITEEQFNTVQQIMESRRTPTGGIYKGNTPYAQKIKCKKCGANYTSNVDRKRKFYNCKTKNICGSTVCNNKNISLKKLDNIFTSEYINKLYEKHFKTVLDNEYTREEILDFIQLIEVEDNTLYVQLIVNNKPLQDIINF